MSDPKSLRDYIKWFSAAYAELRAEKLSQATYRVLEYSKNKKGTFDVHIQLIGKNAVFKSTPQKILADDEMIEFFSKKDIRLLTYLGCQDLKEPKHEVLGQRFVRALNKFFFKLKHDKTGEEIEKSAEEISADPVLIKSLSPEDAHKVGFVAANEQVKKELKNDNGSLK